MHQRSKEWIQQAVAGSMGVVALTRMVVYSLCRSPTACCDFARPWRGQLRRWRQEQDLPLGRFAEDDGESGWAMMVQQGLHAN